MILRRPSTIHSWPSPKISWRAPRSRAYTIVEVMELLPHLRDLERFLDRVHELVIQPLEFPRGDAASVLVPVSAVRFSHMCELSINFHAYKIHSKSSIDKFCSYIHICNKISLVNIIFLSLSVSHFHCLALSLSLSLSLSHSYCLSLSLTLTLSLLFISLIMAQDRGITLNCDKIGLPSLHGDGPSDSPRSRDYVK